MRFVPALAGIVPYVPGLPIEIVMRRYGLSEVVKLASNEFPLPPFDEVKRVIIEALDDLNRYPDGDATDLRAALGAHYGCVAEQIAVGSGSCELLMLLGDALLEKGDEVVFAHPSFVVYNDVCRLHEARAVAVPLVDFTHDLEAMAAAVTPHTKMVLVCNPNNPTGTYVPVADIARLVEAVPGDVLVVVDEAYNEFVTATDSQDALELQKAHDNVIVLRTFSKIYGLCGLRVGYGLCAPEVKSALDKVRQPFNVNLLAHLVERRLDLGRAQAVPDAQAAEAVDLREGAQDDHVVVRLLQLQRVLRVGCRHELVVGLVHDHEHIAGHRLDEPRDVGHRHVGACRVVRVAYQYHLGVRRDGGRHGLQVVREVDEGHGDSASLVQPANVVVDDERWVGEDDLVTLLEQRIAEQHEQLAGPAAHGDLLRNASVVRGQRRAQIGGVAVRIAVQVVEGLDDDPLHLVEGRQRKLVGGELHDLAEAVAPHDDLDRQTGDVGDDAGEGGNEAHGLLRQVEPQLPGAVQVHVVHVGAGRQIDVQQHAHAAFHGALHGDLLAAQQRCVGQADAARRDRREVGAQVGGGAEDHADDVVDGDVVAVEDHAE